MHLKKFQDFGKISRAKKVDGFEKIKKYEKKRKKIRKGKIETKKLYRKPRKSQRENVGEKSNQK